MSRTLIQQARDAGGLPFMLETRGGSTRDQGNNQLPITLPADASLDKNGLYVRTAPASVALDMSGINNFGLFVMATGFRGTGALQTLAELTTNAQTQDGGWRITASASSGAATVEFKGSSGLSSGLAGNISLNTTYIYSFNVDRRLSKEAVKGYRRGQYAPASQVDNNVNDGSGFADSLLYLGARSDSTAQSVARILALGIVDFGIVDQWTLADHAQLYRDIRDRKTI